jgi:membrane associated rhomboid family serine protease
MGARAAVQRDVAALVGETRARVGLVLRSVAVLWAVEVVDVVLGGRLDRLGVQPRSVEGLVGLLFAPFLHAGFGHLLANTVPFVALGFLAAARRRADFWVVSVVSAVTAGLAAWVFGAPGSVHLGASGVVFGFLGFTMGRGIWEKRAGALFLSFLSTFLFGGMLWGVLPLVNPGVSWQSHLGGFLGGLWVARTLGRARGRGR